MKCTGLGVWELVRIIRIEWNILDIEYKENWILKRNDLLKIIKRKHCFCLAINCLSPHTSGQHFFQDITLYVVFYYVSFLCFSNFYCYCHFSLTNGVGISNLQLLLIIIWGSTDHHQGFYINLWNRYREIEK